MRFGRADVVGALGRDRRGLDAEAGLAHRGGGLGDDAVARRAALGEREVEALEVERRRRSPRARARAAPGRAAPGRSGRPRGRRWRRDRAWRARYPAGRRRRQVRWRRCPHEHCSWCGEAVPADDGFRAFEPAGERRAVFCRLEHVVPWVIRGAHWAPARDRRRRAARRARAGLRAVRRAARRHAGPARPPPRRAPDRRRVLRRRAPARSGRRPAGAGPEAPAQAGADGRAQRRAAQEADDDPEGADGGGGEERLAPADRGDDPARRGVAGRDAADERGERPGVGLGERALRGDLPDELAAGGDQRGDRDARQQRERRHHGERAGQRERQRDERHDRERPQVGGRQVDAVARGRRRSRPPQALPSDQIAISGPASAGLPSDSPNAGNATSAAPTQKPIGSVVATSVRTPGLRSAPRRPPVSCAWSPPGS